MAHAGLIESRQDGRYIFYSANYARMDELLAYLTENCCVRNGAQCTTACNTKRTSTRPAKLVPAKPVGRMRAAKRRAPAR
ncbi:MAG: ArsR/SmtB family transcription factor [Sulfuricaulis sp.]